MRTDNGTTISAWIAGNEDLPREKLQRDASADVCIVGAGIAGLTIGYCLAKEGKSVIILDDGPIGGGETCRTTAHIVNALDDRYKDLESYHGLEKATLAAESHSAAIDAVEKFVHDEKIDCGFSRLDGYLILTPGEQKQLLEDERRAAHRCGLKEVELLEKAPFAFTDTGPCLKFPRQGQFKPMQYLHGLAKAIEKHGGKIFTHTHASEIEGGDHARVVTRDEKTVKCKYVVVATNTPVNDRVSIHTKQAPYRTYVIGVRIPKDSVPRMLLWDTGPYSKVHDPVPYHYVRILEDWKKGEDLLIVGGEDHKTGQADDAERRFNRLEDWTKQHFPMAQDVVYQWSGQVMEPVDGFAYIGRNPLDKENVFIATGDSGNGMTHGTIAGLLIRDLIMGEKNPWEEIYNPSRKPPLKAMKSFTIENANVAREYADYVTPGEIRSAREVPKDSGAVMRDGIKKIALYRDAKGELHKFSAVCRHLGCIVSWNSLEKTWDCPCHGARYTKDGVVVNGPANGDLKKIE